MAWDVDFVGIQYKLLLNVFVCMLYDAPARSETIAAIFHPGTPLPLGLS